MAEQPVWSEKIVPRWKNPYSGPSTPPTLAYRYEAQNGITLAVVPELHIFRYDGGVRQSSSAEVREQGDAAHLMRLDVGSSPDKFPAVALAIDIFHVLEERFAPEVILQAIEAYWKRIQNLDLLEAVVFAGATERDLSQKPASLVYS